MPIEQLKAPEYYIRLPKVLEIIPVSRSTWYRGVKSGIYPKQVKISPKLSAWKLEEILECIAIRPRG